MELEQFLRTLVEELDIDTMPSKEEGNLYRLPINPMLTIKIQELETQITLCSDIGPCPKMKREEIFTLLMKANFLGQGTGGAIIGLDENENFLTLSSILSYDLNYKMFKDALEDFVNYLDYWREELIRLTAEENVTN